MVGDWNRCTFNDWSIGATSGSESIAGDKWLEISYENAADEPIGVEFLNAPNKYFVLVNNGHPQANTTWDFFHQITKFHFEARLVFGGGSVSNNYIIFNRSDNQQLFKIRCSDEHNVQSQYWARVYDNNDVEKASFNGAFVGAPYFKYFNITLNVSTQEVRVQCDYNGVSNVIDVWFGISNFDYVNHIYMFHGGGQTFGIDNFSIDLSDTTPTKLWETGDVYAGCANCDYDNFHSLSFASTDTIVVESDYDVFVPGRAVLQVALGIKSDSDISHMESWLRIGDAYNENRTKYYTFGADHYIIVWENIDTLWYESELPLEFKFITGNTGHVLNLFYEHSDNDGDGDIQYKTSMDGDNYNGVYDGDTTFGRDICIEIYHGWSGIAGDVNISVFNASKTSEALEGWNVTIVNKVTGLVEYNESNCNNVLTINTSDIGIGHRLFYISNESYYTRIYYAYIEPFINYTLNAYLLHETIGRYYCFRVLSGATEFGYQLPVYDAQINISRFIVGQGLTLVENLFTDQNGYAVTYLIPGEMYYFNITKTGYTTEITNFVVAQNKEDCYEFIIEGIIPSGPGYDNWYQNISLEANMISAGYLQLGNITVNYSDVNYSTIDTHTYIYEVYNNTRTFMNYSYDYNNSFDLRFGDINTTRTHHLVLFYNNTATFIDQTSPVIIVIDPVHTYIGERTRFPFDDRIKNIIGPFTIKPDIWHPGIDIPWGNILAAIIGCIPLVVFGPKHTAIGIIASGIAIGGLDTFFSIWFTDTFPFLLISLAPILVVLGGVYHKVKGETL